MELSSKTIIELQDVLVAANRGDNESFNGLISRLESRFRVLVKKMLWQFPRVRRWEDTDDVLQATMIRLHRSLTGAQPKSVNQFVGLAATQVRRTLIDLARHYGGTHGHGANHHSDISGRAADEPGGPIERHNRLETQPFSIEEWTQFHEATQQLPDGPREAFELIWYAGLQHSEAADLLGISRRTIIRRINLARRLLSELLTDEQD